MTLEAGAVLWLRSAVGQLLGPVVVDPRPLQPEPRGRLLQSGREPNWSDVAEAARRHNLEPLLFDLAARGAVFVPDQIREAWESQYYRNHIFNLSLLETARELLEDAAKAGIRPVVLKGPVSIARRLHDPGLRVMVDIDLLCRQRDLAMVAELARARGFVAVGENATYHLSFQHPGLGAGLELHFDLYEVLGRRAEFVESVFDGCERLELDGFEFAGPGPAADTVLQLGHILHHDQRLDLRHWLDFALSAQATRGAAELDRLLRMTDLEPEFAENLSIASRLFGVELGGSAGGAAVEALAAVEGGLLDLEDRRAFLAGARTYPGWWARAVYVLRLLAPSPGRWRALAAAEGTGVGTALVRHVGRAIGRGRGKLGRREHAARPDDSPRARLFRRRAGHNT